MGKSLERSVEEADISEEKIRELAESGKARVFRFGSDSRGGVMYKGRMYIHAGKGRGYQLAGKNSLLP